LASIAITAAMLNVGYHAYPEQSEKPWWFNAIIIGEQY